MGSPALDARDRRARVATAGLFLANGALFANLLPRYPEIKFELGLSNTALGLAVAAFSAGALLTGPAAATLIRRFRSSVVAVTGSVLTLIASVGMGAALAFPSVPLTIAGFAAAGFGSATLVPAAMHAADELPGLRPGTGLTVLTWLMRAGFLGSPIVVGAIADASSLRVGLLTVPMAGVAVMLLAGSLRRRPGGSGVFSPRIRSVRS